MNYEESRAYIKAAEKYGSVLGLGNMTELMNRLGNPQDDLTFVHVAGTNGKGSLIAYLYTTLSEAGYHVGRYISPTLYSYRERLEAGGKLVSREQFAGYVTTVSQAIHRMMEDGLPHPTPFEIETAVAFLFFKDVKCDIVLLEVGMGGNLDATNIIKNTKLAVIVSLSMDHMGFLGNTLKEIAEKKAGIIKPGCHVVTVKQQEEAMEAIDAACIAAGAPCIVADGGEAQITEETYEGQTFRYKGEEYQVSLAGVYQKENAVLALNALELLSENGFPTTIEQRKQGLMNAHWSGRFTAIHKEPLFVVDGAHNPGAARMMTGSISHYFKNKNIYYIIGMFKDKDYRTVLEMTAPYAKKILTIETPDNPRALPAEELAAAAREFHPDVTAAPCMADAVEQAFSMAEKEDVIIAFGSLSFIGELTRIVKEREKREND